MGLYLLKHPYRKVLLPLARRMKFVHPDVLSYAATVVAAATAVCYLRAASRPALLLVAVGLTLLRMTLNTLDGVIAIERGNLSLKGEIVNALPDRFSDVFYMLGVMFSPLCDPLWGALGMTSMFLVSYTGMLGKAIGVEWQHHGPLGKVERLILVMVFSLVQYFTLRRGWQHLTLMGLSLTPLEWCMTLYLVLGQVTVFNRLRGMLRQVTRLEWEERQAGGAADPKVLVVYDSVTGNTEKVAREIARSLRAELRRADQVRNAESYDLVVVGTPNIRAKPSAKVREFLGRNPRLGNYAAFVTWGMPIWGRISTPRCFAFFRRAQGRRPLATFSCRGRHAKYGTCGGHPNADELLSAFLFGAKLAGKLERAG